MRNNGSLPTAAYSLGWVIATVSCAFFFVTGMWVQKEYLTPEPCIPNLHSMTHPWFGRVVQKGIENNHKVMLDTFGKQIIKTSDDKLYFVPSGCVATDIDYFDGPVLWRN